MTITPSQIYWISTCDGIIHAGCTIGALALIGGTVAAFLFIIGLTTEDRTVKKIGLVLTWLAWPVAILCLGVMAFFPSSKTVAAMYIVPAIANNEKVQDVGNRIYDLAVEWMQALKPAKKGGAE